MCRAHASTLPWAQAVAAASSVDDAWSEDAPLSASAMSHLPETGMPMATSASPKGANSTPAGCQERTVAAVLVRLGVEGVVGGSALVSLLRVKCE